LEVEVAVGAARRAGLTLGGKVQTHSGVDACGHIHCDLALRTHAPLTRACRARARDDGAVAAAGAAWARRHHVAQQRAHRTLDLSGAVADVAGRHRRARRAARALARFAQHSRVDLDLVLRAEDHLVEVDLDAQQRILTPLGAGTRSRSATAAEEAVEDVADAAIAAAEAALAAHVVAFALLGVAQHVVGVRDVLDPLSGILGRVHIRVQLARQATVRLL